MENDSGHGKGSAKAQEYAQICGYCGRELTNLGGTYHCVHCNKFFQFEQGEK